MVHDGVNWGRYEYDAQGRVIATQNAEGYWTGRFEYPKAGLTLYHNPLGGVTRYHYDAQQRLTKVEHCNEGVSHYHWVGDLLQKTEGALGRVTRYHYDSWGNFTSTEYQYDSSWR